MTSDRENYKLRICFLGNMVILETGVDSSLEVGGGKHLLGTVLNLRTTTSQNCEAVPKRARI